MKMDQIGAFVRPMGFPTTSNAKGGTIVHALLFGKDNDEVFLPGARVGVDLAGLRKLLFRMFKMTPPEFSRLGPRDQDKISNYLRREIEHAYKMACPDKWKKIIDGSYAREEKMRVERGELHRRLRSWATGELRLEKPSGSSLHHCLQYDVQHTEGNFARSLGECQNFVVENNWGKMGLPPGEWRLPFEICCWEFRISGVRVLTFTDASDIEDPLMWCVYGKDGHWVIDDYHYIMRSDGIVRHFSGSEYGADAIEFPAVANFCFKQIRASCIMMDAQVCERETRAAPEQLVRQAKKQQRIPPRNYMVVRLCDLKHRRYVTARSAGAGVNNNRAAQRGHWRRGTWVHFDDQDSGETQYANDGGFVVSKTWRRWHFAGDPNNIIEREYRL